MRYTMHIGTPVFVGFWIFRPKWTKIALEGKTVEAVAEFRRTHPKMDEGWSYAMVGAFMRANGLVVQDTYESEDDSEDYNSEEDDSEDE
jgi:hypothetical protein